MVLRWLKPYMAAEKPFFNDSKKERHLTCSTQHTEFEWNMDLFSHETLPRQNQTNPTYITRPAGARLDPRLTAQPPRTTAV